jgi:hypothetical protein
MPASDPGAMEAGLGSWLFWGSLGAIVAVGFVFGAAVLIAEA